MDKKTMVETDLNLELIAAGKCLVDRLDQEGMSPDVVFWLYSAEDQSWKLVLVEATLSLSGPKAGYSRLQKVLSQYEDELQPLELADIVIERPNSRLVRLIAKTVHTKDKAVRFRNNVLDGTLIDDAYIYRSRKRA